jgi:hypothetical protein
MQAKRIAVLSYRKYPGEDWPVEEFGERCVELVGKETVALQLAERGTRLSNGLWVREVRKRSARRRCVRFPAPSASRVHFNQLSAALVRGPASLVVVTENSVRAENAEVLIIREILVVSR